MARKHYSARGQQKQLEEDEGATRIHGKSSRGLGKNLHRRAERDFRKIPRLLGRVRKPRRSNHLRVCVQIGDANCYRNFELICP